MRRRELGVSILCAMIAHAPGTIAQPSSRSRARAQIGILWPNSADARPRAPFHARLRELGYIEGSSLEIHERFADGQLERLPDLARGLVELKVNVIVAFALAATVAARNATSTIPIVMVYAGDPVETGLIQSLARPGGNVTGTTSMLTDLVGKQLQLVSEILPRSSRVAILHNPTNVGAQEGLREAKTAAAALRLALFPIEVSRAGDLAAAFEAILQAKVDALLVLVEPFIQANRARIIEFAGRARLPAVYSVAEVVRDGGLLAYGNSIAAHINGAASYVDKILKGANPAELPVQQPIQFELVINLRTAQTLGITIPPAVLARADEVIE